MYEFLRGNQDLIRWVGFKRAILFFVFLLMQLRTLGWKPSVPIASVLGSLSWLATFVRRPPKEPVDFGTPVTPVPRQLCLSAWSGSVLLFIIYTVAFVPLVLFITKKELIPRSIAEAKKSVRLSQDIFLIHPGAEKGII